VVPVVRMVPQKLYVPRGMVTVMDAMMMPMAVPARRGDGYDVLTAARGMPGYSPICEVVTYTIPTAVPMAPPPSVDTLPKDAAVIENDMALKATFMSGTPRYVYCLQVR